MAQDPFERQLKVMLSLQDGINSQINASWRAARNPWYRAIWTECAELMDHIGWKWWRSQAPNVGQLHLELVDVFHFGLSDVLQHGRTATDLLTDFSASRLGITTADDLLAQVEAFAHATLAHRRFDAVRFFQLCNSANLSSDQLFRIYVSKNVLNRFRQDNGYKSGGYVKVWNGREDNEWLEEAAAKLDAHSPVFADNLYHELAEIYREVSR